jgi:hypothetical protein
MKSRCHGLGAPLAHPHNSRNRKLFNITTNLTNDTNKHTPYFFAIHAPRITTERTDSYQGAMSREQGAGSSEQGAGSREQGVGSSDSCSWFQLIAINDATEQTPLILNTPQNFFDFFDFFDFAV